MNHSIVPLYRKGSSFRGSGTVSSISGHLFAQNGKSYRRIKLLQPETQEFLDCYAWHGQYSGPDEIPPGSLIFISGQEQFDAKQRRSIICKVIRFEPPNEFDLLYSNDDQFHLLLQQLDHPILIEFINSLIKNPVIAYKWRFFPASRDHHHAYICGLMQHSLEVAFWILKETQTLGEPGKITTVAGLLHNIGKIETHEEDGSLNPLGLNTHHEQLTLLILAPHLGPIKQKKPDIYNRLISLLTHKQKRPYQSRPTLLEETLSFADRRSAMRAIGSLPTSVLPLESPQKKEALPF